MSDSEAKVHQFDSILVANRGEIACRVIRTAQRLSYRAIAVYSEPDADAAHVRLADEAYALQGSTSSESYLDIAQIVAACEATGAGAVHPGYGFLSENTAFASACEAAGVIFIGPPAAAIELMGSKRLSKVAMLKAGVPCIPGYEDAAQDTETLKSAADAIGYPLMIKASAGGGGRGMRLVQKAADFEAQLKTARSEALNAFGSDEVILEKAVIEPRHIEIQVMADRYGHTIHLGERDCSIQRRHQKVVEEAPSPVVSEALRQQMGEAAVRAASSCGYSGAGTVEFLLDRSGSFYFLEMNTRLQVEHPVTEMVTGLDLVAMQIEVAAGRQLKLQQSDIVLRGHAIEVRVYAEDPSRDFLPQTGHIALWQHQGKSVDELGLITDFSGAPTAVAARSGGLRVDDGFLSGQTISPYYDPMLAKVIGFGPDRETARRHLLKGLDNMTLFGLTSNLSFLSSILRNSEFISGRTTTAFLQQQSQALGVEQDEAGLALALAALVIYLKSDPRAAGLKASGALAIPVASNIILQAEDSETSAQAVRIRRIAAAGQTRQQQSEPIFEVTAEHGRHEFRVLTTEADAIMVVIDRRRIRVPFIMTGPEGGRSVWLKVREVSHTSHHAFTDVTRQRKSATASVGDGRIYASMDGLVIAAHASEGDIVKQGELLFTLEAMKIEHPLTANASGRLAAVHVSAGTQVKGRQLLAEIEIQPDE
ncbi:MAG: 3-methylcrotonyl-CoA carboxylase [unclassified Hahellaceae]|nr:3-methylcrotonyl-CoA carboxylase [Hahellaceae bacterium]|tara:strand:+ start:62953 stop:65073 length:2121 start_codon:yes stop_codon:yes gene_type:complete